MVPRHHGASRSYPQWRKSDPAKWSTNAAADPKERQISALRLIDAVVAALAALVLTASTAMICLNVFYRYAVLGWLRTLSETEAWAESLYQPLDAWLGAISVTADEVPGLLLVWIAFLGAYLAMRKGGHISFGLVMESLVGAVPVARQNDRRLGPGGVSHPGDRPVGAHDPGRRRHRDRDRERGPGLVHADPAACRRAADRLACGADSRPLARRRLIPWPGPSSRCCSC